MGIEDLKINPQVKAAQDPFEVVHYQDLAVPQFQSKMVPNPKLGIWLMNMPKHTPVLPWWNYKPEIDEDIHSLNQIYSVPNPQAVFDLLFLNEISQLGGKNLYVIFTGNIRTEGWAGLREEERNVFNRGQRCVYHLEAVNHKKMSINWVPFYHPQSMVKDPRFGSLWRLFQAKQDKEDLANSISFISVSNPLKLPDIIANLIKKVDNRSVELAEHVDFFGVYSSPMKSDTAAMSAIYTKHEDILLKLKGIEESFMKKYDFAKTELLQTCHPRTVTKILSRSVIF